MTRVAVFVLAAVLRVAFAPSGLSSEPPNPGVHAPARKMVPVERAVLCRELGCPVEGGG